VSNNRVQRTSRVSLFAVDTMLKLGTWDRKLVNNPTSPCPNVLRNQKVGCRLLRLAAQLRRIRNLAFGIHRIPDSASPGGRKRGPLLLDLSKLRLSAADAGPAQFRGSLTHSSKGASVNERCPRVIAIRTIAPEYPGTPRYGQPLEFASDPQTSLCALPIRSLQRTPSGSCANQSDNPCLGSEWNTQALVDSHPVKTNRPT